MKRFILQILFLITALYLNIHAQGQQINTFAGNHSGGFSGDGGPATAASLGVPWSVAVDNSGNVFIADVSECVVRKVDIHGVITTVAGSDTPGYSGDNGPAVLAKLNSPESITIDAAGNLYIADNGNYAVRKVDTSGIITTIAGNGINGYSGDGLPATGATLTGAAGLALDAAGNLYISDGISCIRKVNTTGIINLYAGSTSAAGYSGDHGAALSALLHSPCGLATDDTGNLYIADNQNNVIRKIDTLHTITTIAGNGDFAGLGYGGYSGDSVSALSAELNLPFGICVDRQGNLLIADMSNNIVRCVSAAGIIYTIAGDPGFPGYSGDGGPVSFSFLNNPSGMAIDAHKNLYIADADNNAVRKVDAISIYSNGTDTICYGDTASFLAATFWPDTGLSYQWKKNGLNVGTDSTTFITDSILNGDIISCSLLYGGPAIATGNSDDITMIWRSLPPSVTVSASPGDTVCVSSNVTFTATGGSSLTYEWLKNGEVADYGSTYMFLPVTGDQIVCVVSGSSECGVSAPFIVRVDSYAVPEIFISSPSGLSVCPSAPALFTAAADYGGTSPLYKWEVNGDSVTTTPAAEFSYLPSSGDVITCTLISNYVCRIGDTARSSPIDITLTPYVIPSVSVSTTAPDTLCAGSTVTVSATITNGGSSPSLQWFKNGIPTVTDSSYIFVPADGDDIKCVLTSSACSNPDTAGSNHINFSVSPVVTPGITIATATDSVCSGTIVTYTLTDTNAGSSPTFLWKVNGTNVDSGTSYSYVPVNGDIIKCQITSDANCLSTATAVSDNITMYVDNVMLTPSATIASVSGDTVCTGSTVTYTATVVNGGTAPAYQWKVNGIPSASGTGVSYTYTPVNGDIISCIITSNAHCLVIDTAISDSVIMHVNPVFTPSVSISIAPGSSICEGTVVTYTATAFNAGTTPLYLWRVNGFNSGTSDTYSYTPANGDAISCIITTSAACTTADTVSESISMTVNPVVTPEINIAESTTGSICAGTNVTYSATPVNGGPSPTYQWIVNSITIAAATGHSYTYAPLNGDIIDCILTSNAACATPDTAISAEITMTVNADTIPAISVTTVPGATICAGTSVTYSATGVNGGASPTYQWKVNGTDETTGTTYTYTPINGDHITCLITSDAICATPDTVSSVPVIMTVNNEVTPTVTISASPGSTVTTVGEAITFTASVLNGGSSPTYQWYINNLAIPGANSSIFTVDTFLTSDSVYCVITSNAPCTTVTSATSNTQSITVSVGVSQLSVVENNIALIPNPNNGSFTIKGNLGSGTDEQIIIEITDMLGHIIYQHTEPAVQGKIDTAVNLNNCSNGMYFLNIHSGASSGTTRFVIEK